MRRSQGSKCSALVIRPAQWTVRQSNQVDPIERRHDYDDVPDPLRSATSGGCVDVRSVIHRSGCANLRRHGPWNCDESPHAGCASPPEHAGAYNRCQHRHRLAQLHHHSFARTPRGEPSAAHCVLSVESVLSRRGAFWRGPDDDRHGRLRKRERHQLQPPSKPQSFRSHPAP